MAKAFFRFLRGELNGYYVTRIQQVCNELSKEYKDFLVEFAGQQFERGKIDATTLNNLGKFAGIFLPRVSKEEASTSIRLDESEYDSQLDYEFSERGLFRPANEDFVFEQKTLDDTGLPDINTLATTSKRSSMVEAGKQVAGYIPDDEVDIFADGVIVPSAIQPIPPENQAYNDFYDNTFVFLSDSLPSYESLSPDVFLELFKALQTVRYRGMSVVALVKITNILCPLGLVRIAGITAGTNLWTLSYHIDMTVETGNQQDRINMWTYILKIKFPQVVLLEV